MAVEKARGCGFRRVGGQYLVGSGLTRSCDMLPVKLLPCPTCGFIVPFNRGFMWLSKKWIESYAKGHRATVACTCPEVCSLCFPETNDLKKYGFMWVGSNDYSPGSFMAEARSMGISKRIAKIPKGLKLGKTWVLLGHRKVPFSPSFHPEGMHKKEPEYAPGVFYAFVPRRVEKLIWKSQATPGQLKKMKKQGITPVIIPDGDKDHAPKPKKR
jgi:hypothetical protein